MWTASHVTKPTYGPFKKFLRVKNPRTSTEIQEFICETSILEKWDFPETSENKLQKCTNLQHVSTKRCYFITILIPFHKVQ